MDFAALRLAPLAFLPAFQRQGIGSLLVRVGLEHGKKANISWVVVPGESDYYHRAGLISAEEHGLSCAFDAPKGAFTAIEMPAAAPQGCAAVVQYQPEFHEV